MVSLRIAVFAAFLSIRIGEDAEMALAREDTVAVPHPAAATRRSGPNAVAVAAVVSDLGSPTSSYPQQRRTDPRRFLEGGGDIHKGEAEEDAVDWNDDDSGTSGVQDSTITSPTDDNDDNDDDDDDDDVGDDQVDNDHIDDGENVGSKDEVVEQCEKVGECMPCQGNTKDMHTPDVCSETGRREKVLCTETKNGAFTIKRTFERYQSCTRITVDEQFRLIQFEIVCLLIGMISIVSIKRQKRASASLFDQRRTSGRRALGGYSRVAQGESNRSDGIELV